MSEVTILLPVLKGATRQEWLDQCIRSFPKGTPYLILENDGEMGAALNAGLEAAQTEFVVTFGHDDIALPGYLDHMLGPAWNADVVYPSMILVSEDLSTVVGQHDADPFCPNRLLDFNYIAGPSLVRRSKAIEVGGWRDLENLEDWDMWVRMHRAGARFKPCQEARLAYRQREGSRVSRGHEDGYAKLKAKIVGESPAPLATFYSQATPATTYVRCQLPARVLPGVVMPQAALAFNGDGAIVLPNQRGDTAIFQYAADSSRALMAAHMRAQGLRVLVEVDDNYLINPGKRILGRQQWGLRIGEKSSTRQGHRSIVEKADGVIVTTEHLADQYRAVNENVYVCPNTVDPADWVEPVKPDDGVLRVAWFASQSHEDDIPLVSRAFEWASRQKDVEVYVVGMHPNSRLKFKDRWRFDYGHVPWVDDLDLYRFMFQQFDVGVAPVCRTPMGLGRSDLKALEYSCGGMFSILQDAAPYEWWRDKPALLAQDGRDFLKHVKWAVANRDEVAALAREARQLVLRERTNLAQRDLWLEAIKS